MKMLKTIELCTFPEDDKNYCHVFEVSTKWIRKFVQNIKFFLSYYTWDDTYNIYHIAVRDERVLNKYEQE